MSAALAGWVEALAQQLEALGHGDSPMVQHAKAAVVVAKAAPLAEPPALIRAMAELIDAVDDLHPIDAVVRELNRAGVAERLSKAAITAQTALHSYQKAPPASAPSPELEALVRRHIGPNSFFDSQHARIDLEERLGLIRPQEASERRAAWDHEHRRGQRK